MEFQDRTLRCADCGSDFVWTSGEQAFFADKRFTNEPKRCKACKAKRVQRRAIDPAAGRDRSNAGDLFGVREGDHRPVQAEPGPPCIAATASSSASRTGLTAPEAGRRTSLTASSSCATMQARMRAVFSCPSAQGVVPNWVKGTSDADRRTELGDVTILDLKGKLTLGDGDELLRSKINGLVQAGQKRIVLKLGEVPYIDSAGLGRSCGRIRRSRSTRAC